MFLLKNISETFGLIMLIGNSLFVSSPSSTQTNVTQSSPRPFLMSSDNFRTAKDLSHVCIGTNRLPFQRSWIIGIDEFLLHLPDKLFFARMFPNNKNPFSLTGLIVTFPYLSNPDESFFSEKVSWDQVMIFLCL